MRKGILLSVLLIGVNMLASSVCSSENPFSPDPVSDSTERVGRCRICLPDRPDKNCCFVLVVETGYLFATNRDHTDKFPPSEFLTFDLGLIRRITQKDAIGATISILNTDEYSRFGIRSRYRRWLDKQLSLDLTAGVVLGGDESHNTNIGSGLIASASLGIRDLIAFDLLLIRAKYTTRNEIYDRVGTPPRIETDSFSETNIYLGITGRSYMAAVAAALWATAALVAAASFSGF